MLDSTRKNQLRRGSKRIQELQINSSRMNEDPAWRKLTQGVTFLSYRMLFYTMAALLAVSKDQALAEEEKWVTVGDEVVFYCSHNTMLLSEEDIITEVRLLSDNTVVYELIHDAVSSEHKFSQSNHWYILATGMEDTRSHVFFITVTIPRVQTKDRGDITCQVEYVHGGKKHYKTVKIMHLHVDGNDKDLSTTPKDHILEEFDPWRHDTWPDLTFKNVMKTALTSVGVLLGITVITFCVMPKSWIKRILESTARKNSAAAQSATASEAKTSTRTPKTLDDTTPGHLVVIMDDAYMQSYTSLV